MKCKVSMKKFFDFYFFIFIFTTINREFVFFGIDLRFIQVAMSLFLILKDILSILVIKLEKYEILIIF